MAAVGAYADVDDVADFEVGGVAGDGAVVVGAAVHEALAAGVGGVDEDFLHLTLVGGELFVVDFLLPGEDAGEAFFFDFTGDVVLQAFGFGAGAGGVFEGEDLAEADFFQAGHGAFEIFFGLAGEAHDEVGAELHVGVHLLEILYLREVFVQRVVAAHGMEDAVAAGLEGEVELVGDAFAARHEVGEIVVPVFGVGRGKADALQALDFRHVVEQLIELVILGGAVGINILPEQPDFFGALADEGLGFHEDVVVLTGYFPAPGEGDDAVGAHVVAPFGDGDVGLDAFDMAALDPLFGDEILYLVIPGEPLGVADPFALLDGLDHLGELEEIVGSEDHVDGLVPLEDFFAFLLGDAARDANNEAGVGLFTVPQGADEAIDFIFRIVADGTGVYEDEIGLVLVFRELIAFALQHGPHLKAVVFIHLTAESFYVCTFCHGGSRAKRLLNKVLEVEKYRSESHGSITSCP